MALTCPKCTAVILPEEINVQSDVAMCRSCGTMHKAADLVHDEVLDQTAAESAAVMQGPKPPGVSWSDDGQTLRIGAGIGSKAIAAFLGVFAAFWTLPAVFVAGDLVQDLLWPATPGAAIEDGTPAKSTEFEREQARMAAEMDATMQIGDMLMGATLLVIAGVFWVGALTALRARVRITVRPDLGTVKKGAFPFIITKHFDPARVTAVNEVLDTGTRVNGKNPTKIVIKADDEIGFGGFMPEIRRKWVAAVLRANLLRRR